MYPCICQCCRPEAETCLKNYTYSFYSKDCKYQYATHTAKSCYAWISHCAHKDFFNILPPRWEFLPPFQKPWLCFGPVPSFPSTAAYHKLCMYRLTVSCEGLMSLFFTAPSEPKSDAIIAMLFTLAKIQMLINNTNHQYSMETKYTVLLKAVFTAQVWEEMLFARWGSLLEQCKGIWYHPY